MNLLCVHFFFSTLDKMRSMKSSILKYVVEILHVDKYTEDMQTWRIIVSCYSPFTCRKQHPIVVRECKHIQQNLFVLMLIRNLS